MATHTRAPFSSPTATVVLECVCPCHADCEHCTSCCTHPDLDGICDDCRYYLDAPVGDPEAQQ